ncbi:hypothetical protein HUS23_12915 [Ectothiorhodospiraceae bacterium 2226]|nr:hypothetical protein HUS23_12915 [Ectothiorhodospiraceae bacterium 2226]
MTMFQLFQILQLILGAMMWTLIGQGLLALLLRERRHENSIYKVMGWVTWPARALARALTPRVVVDEHIPLLAFLLIIMVRVGLYMWFYAQGWIPTIDVAAP